MSGASLLNVIWVVWGVVTAAFVMLLIWKSLAGLKEDGGMILASSEGQQAAEQQQVVARVERITRWAKYLGIASAGLLLVSGGVWVYRGFIAFNGGQIP
jgi:hypothetical protein